MNAQTQISNSNQSVGLLNLESFELSQRIAKMLSSSTLVPEQYRATIQKKAGKDEYGNQQWREEPNPNGLSNCIIALNMSNRMGADPLMVMQNLYLVNGRPSWSSQFIMAGINSSGRFSALRFELEDLGMKEIECSETIWENRKPKKITKTVKVHDFSCVAWAIERETGERLESSKITIEMAVKEGWYTKEGSKWQTMSEQMLRYRAASFFGRVYAPELLMGLRSAEEEQDRIIDVTPSAESTVIQASNFKQIRSLVLKAKSLEALEELESSIYALSDESEREELIKLWKAQADKYKVTDVNESSAEEIEPQPEEVPPVEAEEKVQKPKTSAASLNIRKEYLVKMNQAESNAELNELREQFIIDDRLTEAHLAYLKDAYAQHKERINPVQSVNQIKSNNLKNGFKTMIVDANTVADLEKLGTQIRDSKPQLSTDDMAEILKDYAARKKFLEDQQDMFADVNESVSYVDAVIARIQSAESQDDINAEYTDPAIDELSDKDKQRIDLAAQKREEELQR